MLKLSTSLVMLYFKFVLPFQRTQSISTSCPLILNFVLISILSPSVPLITIAICLVSTELVTDMKIPSKTENQLLLMTAPAFKSNVHDKRSCGIQSQVLPNQNFVRSRSLNALSFINKYEIFDVKDVKSGVLIKLYVRNVVNQTKLDLNNRK